MSIVITVKVIPNAKKTNISLAADGTLKIHLQAPPIDGKANQELVTFLAKKLKLSKQKISILSGLTCRIKRLAIETELSQEELFVQLGIEKQLSLI